MNQIQPNRIEPYECVIKCIFSHFVTWIWFNLDWDRQPANIKWNERGVKGNATYEWNEMEFCVAQILWSNVRQLNWASKAASIFMEIWKSFSLLGLTAPFCSSLFSCWCMTKFSSSGACYFPRAPLDFKENNWQDFKQRISLLFISIFPTPFATSIERWRLLLMFLFFRCFYFLFILIWPAASCTAQPPGKSA